MKMFFFKFKIFPIFHMSDDVSKIRDETRRNIASFVQFPTMNNYGQLQSISSFLSSTNIVIYFFCFIFEGL